MAGKLIFILLQILMLVIDSEVALLKGDSMTRKDYISKVTHSSQTVWCSSNALSLHVGGARFDSWPGHWLS
jgi:hypothetical protein